MLLSNLNVNDLESELAEDLALWQVKRMSEAISVHYEHLEFEAETNRIKAIIKWIYAVGLALSFIFSLAIIDFYAKRQMQIQ